MSYDLGQHYPQRGSNQGVNSASNLPNPQHQFNQNNNRGSAASPRDPRLHRQNFGGIPNPHSSDHSHPEHFGQLNAPQQEGFPAQVNAPFLQQFVQYNPPFDDGANTRCEYVPSFHASQNTQANMNSLKNKLAQTLHNIQTTSCDSESYNNSNRNTAPNAPHFYSHLPHPQNTPLHSMPPPASAFTRPSNRNNTSVEYVPGDVRYRPAQNTQNTNHSGNSAGSGVGGVDRIGTGTYPTYVSQTVRGGAGAPAHSAAPWTGGGASATVRGSGGEYTSPVDLTGAVPRTQQQLAPPQHLLPPHYPVYGGIVRGGSVDSMGSVGSGSDISNTNSNVHTRTIPYTNTNLNYYNLPTDNTTPDNTYNTPYTTPYTAPVPVRVSKWSADLMNPLDIQDAMVQTSVVDSSAGGDNTGGSGNGEQNPIKRALMSYQANYNVNRINPSTHTNTGNASYNTNSAATKSAHICANARALTISNTNINTNTNTNHTNNPTTSPTSRKRPLSPVRSVCSVSAVNNTNTGTNTSTSTNTSTNTITSSGTTGGRVTRFGSRHNDNLYSAGSYSDNTSFRDSTTTSTGTGKLVSKDSGDTSDKTSNTPVVYSVDSSSTCSVSSTDTTTTTAINTSTNTTNYPTNMNTTTTAPPLPFNYHHYPLHTLFTHYHIPILHHTTTTLRSHTLSSVFPTLYIPADVVSVTVDLCSAVDAIRGSTVKQEVSSSVNSSSVGAHSTCSRSDTLTEGATVSYQVRVLVVCGTAGTVSEPVNSNQQTPDAIRCLLRQQGSDSVLFGGSWSAELDSCATKCNDSNTNTSANSTTTSTTANSTTNTTNTNTNTTTNTTTTIATNTTTTGTNTNSTTTNTPVGNKSLLIHTVQRVLQEQAGIHIPVESSVDGTKGDTQYYSAGLASIGEITYCTHHTSHTRSSDDSSAREVDTKVATVALYLYVLPPSLHTPTTGSSWTTVTTLADVWHSDDKPDKTPTTAAFERALAGYVVQSALNTHHADVVAEGVLGPNAEMRLPTNPPDPTTTTAPPTTTTPTTPTPHTTTYPTYNAPEKDIHVVCSVLDSIIDTIENDTNTNTNTGDSDNNNTGGGEYVYGSTVTNSSATSSDGGGDKSGNDSTSEGEGKVSSASSGLGGVDSGNSTAHSGSDSDATLHNTTNTNTNTTNTVNTTNATTNSATSGDDMLVDYSIDTTPTPSAPSSPTTTNTGNTSSTNDTTNTTAPEKGDADIVKRNGMLCEQWHQRFLCAARAFDVTGTGTLSYEHLVLILQTSTRDLTRSEAEAAARRVCTKGDYFRYKAYMGK